jgi:hypothetical protein
MKRRVKEPIETHRFTLALDSAGRIRRRHIYGVRCGARGCKENGNGCWLPDDMDQPSEWYCYGHMRDAGYCPGCGNFWAGVESFDLSRTGYCENCASEFEEPDYDDWNDDSGGFYWDEPRADPWDEALTNCFSSDWGETCGAAGSEDCEFDCLIRRDRRRMERKEAQA